MGLNDILVVTVSGVRTGEEDAVRALVGGCGLPVEDITDAEFSRVCPDSAVCMRKSIAA